MVGFEVSLQVSWAVFLVQVPAFFHRLVYQYFTLAMIDGTVIRAFGTVDKLAGLVQRGIRFGLEAIDEV